MGGCMIARSFSSLILYLNGDANCTLHRCLYWQELLYAHGTWVRRTAKTVNHDNFASIAHRAHVADLAAIHNNRLLVGWDAGLNF